MTVVGQSYSDSDQNSTEIQNPTEIIDANTRNNNNIKEIVANQDHHREPEANTKSSNRRMGRRKQNCPQKTGVGAADGKDPLHVLRSRSASFQEKGHRKKRKKTTFVDIIC